MPSELQTERRGTTLVLTISDPASRNTLSAQVIAAGIEALGVAESNPEVRAVVLQGAGGHFCAGGNVHGLIERRAAGEAAQRRMLEDLHHWIETIASFPKPVIAAVEGAAAGAGFSLALACDLIVAANDAKFVMSYARVGLTPDGGGSWFLARALPRALAAEILFEGRPVAAERLHALGVVNRLATPGAALGDALAWADTLGALSPNALTRIKALLDDAIAQPLATHLGTERDHFVASLHHPDAFEGITAFLEKRPATYKR